MVGLKGLCWGLASVVSWNMEGSVITWQFFQYCSFTAWNLLLKITKFLFFHLCSGWVQRVQIVASSISTFLPTGQRLAVPLVGKSTLVVGGSLGLTHGSSTCGAPPAPSTTPRSCHWPRVSSLNKYLKVWVILSCLTVHTLTVQTRAMYWGCSFLTGQWLTWAVGLKTAHTEYNTS